MRSSLFCGVNQTYDLREKVGLHVVHKVKADVQLQRHETDMPKQKRPSLSSLHAVQCDHSYLLITVGEGKRRRRSSASRIFFFVLHIIIIMLQGHTFQTVGYLHMARSIARWSNIPAPSFWPKGFPIVRYAEETICS